MAQKPRKTTKAKLPRGNPRGGIPGDIMPGETAGLVDVNPLSAEALLGDPQLTDAERALLKRLSNTTPSERALEAAAGPRAALRARDRAAIQSALADAKTIGQVDPELAKIIGKADFADRRAAMRAGVRKSVLEAERAAVGEVPKMSAKAARAARSAAAEAAAAGADGVETAAAVQAAIKKAGGTVAGAAGEAASVASKAGFWGRVGGVASKALPTLGVLAGLYTLYEATIGRAQEDRHQGAADLLNTAMGMEGYGDELANRSYARTLDNVTPAASELQYASQMNAVQDQGQLGQMLSQNQAALSQAAHVSTPSFQEYLLELRAAQAAAYGGN